MGRRSLDAVGHEPAPVARACSPAYLLGSPKLTWHPRHIDAWACAPCSRHIHGTHASTAIIVAVVIKPDELFAGFGACPGGSDPAPPELLGAPARSCRRAYP